MESEAPDRAVPSVWALGRRSRSDAVRNTARAWRGLHRRGRDLRAPAGRLAARHADVRDLGKRTRPSRPGRQWLYWQSATPSRARGHDPGNVAYEQPGVASDVEN